MREHPRLQRGKGARRARRGLRLETLERRELLSAQPPLIADAAPYSADLTSAVYRQALDRPVDSTALNYFVTLLDEGRPTSAVANAVVNSDEYAARAVQSAFQQFVARNADPASVSLWVQVLHAGITDEQLIATLAASSEFSARAGGDNTAWIQAAYQAILHRSAANSDIAFWLNRLQAGESRFAVANDMATSMEHAVQTVKAAYNFYLPAPYSETMYESVAARLSSGQMTDEQLIIGILGSKAYYEAQTGVPPSIVPMPGQLPSWPSLFTQIQATAAKGDSPVVFLGDSITENWQFAGQPVWSQYFAPLDALNAGIGGDTTQNVLWRIEHGELNGLSPKVVVLMVGVNNVVEGDTAPEIAAGVAADVEALRQQWPNTKIMVLSVLPAVIATTPPWNLMPTGLAVDNLLSGIGDGQHVFYVNLWPEFTNPDGSFNPALHDSSGLHLNQAGYAVMAQAIAPTVNQLLAQP